MFRLGLTGRRGGEFDVVIVGAGPAGLTAGMYLARLGLNVAILEKETPGGRAATAPIVEDYPGVERTTGAELMKKFEYQAKKFGAKIFINENVVDVEKRGDVYVVKTKVGNEYRAPSIIIATGLTVGGIKVPGEKELFGKGVSYCAVCDGPMFKDKPVALVGSDDHAMEEALYLSTVASKVYVIPHGELEASEEMIKALKNTGKVDIIDRAKVIEIKGNNKVESIVIEKDGKREELKVDAVFISKGEVPTAEVFKKIGVQLDEKGFVKVTPKMETGVPGVYAAGDVTGIGFQIVTAAGQGATAALEAYKYVKSHKKKKTTVAA